MPNSRYLMRQGVVNNNLKEASQSLSEWAEQSVSMQQEVEELRTQVESLKNGAK